MNGETRPRAGLRGTDEFGAFVAVRPDPSFGVEGPLRGAWVAVKDNISVAGLPHTAGHPLFADRLATADADAVLRLRQAGARVLGVTRTDAGGFGVTTPAVTNPVLPGCTAGGSSGGSAAAVAAGLADIGLGTDTGGSVRIPAACCGLLGFKPSFGRVPLDGVWPMAPGLDHVGLMTRELELLRVGAEALLRSPMKADGRTPRFGIDMAWLNQVDPTIARSLLDVVEGIRRLGFEVAPVQLPEQATVADVHGVLVLGQTREVYSGLWPLAASQLGGTAHRALCLAQSIDAAAMLHAALGARAIIESLDKVFCSVDVILTPTLPVDVPPSGARSVRVNGEKTPVVNALTSQTCIANVTGCPAVVLPMTSGFSGRTVSVQLLARQGMDAPLLGYCFHLTTMLATNAGRKTNPEFTEGFATKALRVGSGAASACRTGSNAAF
jgi:Asp-tRNA(Asn)/Glu-tRNA(Gln) amidotransferase A subunit family amidase